MSDKTKPEADRSAPPDRVPPMPVGLPTSNAERPHDALLRHGDSESEDPSLPAEPSHDINP